MDGNENALRQLIEQYQNYVFQIVYGVVRHSKDAEDITQEVMLQMYRSLPTYRSQGFKSWLSRIAVNKSIDHKRKMARKREELTEAIEQVSSTTSHENVELSLLNKEKKDFIQKRIDELPSNHRSVVYAYYIEEKSYQQIAEEQGLAVKSIESKLYRAKAWIRNNWKEEEF